MCECTKNPINNYLTYINKCTTFLRQENTSDDLISYVSNVRRVAWVKLVGKRTKKLFTYVDTLVVTVALLLVRVLGSFKGGRQGRVKGEGVGVRFGDAEARERYLV